MREKYIIQRKIAKRDTASTSDCLYIRNADLLGRKRSEKEGEKDKKIITTKNEGSDVQDN